MTIPHVLGGYAPGVPAGRLPVYWSLGNSVQENMTNLQDWINKYSPLLPSGCQFDEVAILVPSLYHRDKIIRQLAAANWEVFNEAKDLVCTNPFGTRYFVKYLFLRLEDCPVRIEIMMLDEGAEDMRQGYSPLHRALWSDGNPPATASTQIFPIPHLSFKPARSEYEIWGPLGKETKHQTWGQAYSATVQHLKEKGCLHAQTCQSTYGKFGYYLPNDTSRQLYIKPRVNMRDGDVS